MKRALFDRLDRWATVDLLDPESEHLDLSDRDYDLYHMAKRRNASLTDLERATKVDISTVNPFHSAWMTSDRLLRSASLDKHGIPVPTHEYGTADEITLTPPVIIKPRWEWGANAHQFTVVRTPPLNFDGRKLVEEYVPHDQVFKAYGVGEAVRFVDQSRWDVVERVPGAVEELFARVRSVFDLTVLEVDIARTGNNYNVFDVNPVVSLAGVDDAVSIYETELRERCSADVQPIQPK